MPTRTFYGWPMVVFASFALALTGPGQTVGLSVFVDPLINDIGISRTQLTVAYLIGTLIGATALPSLGRSMDRFGIRKAMAGIGLAFGASLLALSFATNIFGLTIGFVMIRMMGQGALSIAATTVIASWFIRRRGLALGIVGAAGAVGISMTPLIANQLIAAFGWRAAWQIEGLFVLLTIVPLALFFIRNKPEDIGQLPDGGLGGDAPPAISIRFTAGQAMQTPAFWIIAAAITMTATFATAVAFHQIGLLTSRGLTPTEAAANFLPQIVATLTALTVVGALADRVSGRLIISASMIVLSAGLVWAIFVEPGWSAIVFGVLIGFAGGITRVVDTVELPKYFGLAHLGAIRGRVTAAAVTGSAIGPLIFAVLQGTDGDYTVPLVVAAVLPIPVAVMALRFRAPTSPTPERCSRRSRDRS